MNAQEAINQFEILLNALKEQNEYSDVLLYGGDTLEPDVIKITDKGFEALSIVLESAKLFHEVATPLPMLNGLEMELEYEPRWLMPDEVEAVGLKFEYIDEGADE